MEYRVHLELATISDAHQAELVARLKELGATPADVGQGDTPWGEAIGWTVHELTDDHELLRSVKGGVGPYLEFRRMHDGEVVWNRIPLDVMSDPVEDQAREVARLEGLGAIRADVGQGDISWALLADPAGNEFCVLGRG